MFFSIDANLALTPLQISDAVNVYTLVEANRTRLGKYLYWVNDVIDVPSARSYINARIHSNLPGAHWFGVQRQGELAGIFAIKSITYPGGIAELGYWLAGCAQRQGIIPRILAALPQLFTALSVNDVNVLEFRCLSGNLASIRIAEKAGAICVDTLTGYACQAHQLQDLLVMHANFTYGEALAAI